MADAPPPIGAPPPHPAKEDADCAFIARLQAVIDLAGGQSALARAAGVSQAVIHRYLNGGDPSRTKLIAIANGAGVSVLWLATGEGSMRPDTAPERHSHGSADGPEAVNFTPELEIIVGNAVAGMEHWRRRDGLSLSPELEGRLTAHVCSILARQLNWCRDHGQPLPDYLAAPDKPYDFIAAMEEDPNPDAGQMAAMFRALAQRR